MLNMFLSGSSVLKTQVNYLYYNAASYTYVVVSPQKLFQLYRISGQILKIYGKDELRMVPSGIVGFQSAKG